MIPARIGGLRIRGGLQLGLPIRDGLQLGLTGRNGFGNSRQRCGHEALTLPRTYPWPNQPKQKPGMDANLPLNTTAHPPSQAHSVSYPAQTLEGVVWPWTASCLSFLWKPTEQDLGLEPGYLGSSSGPATTALGAPSLGLSLSGLVQESEAHTSLEGCPHQGSAAPAPVPSRTEPSW